MKRLSIIAAIVFPVHLLASGIMMFVSYYFEFIAKPETPGVHHWLIHRMFGVLIFPGWMLSEFLIRSFGDIGHWITPAILLPSSIVWTAIILAIVTIIKKIKGVPNNNVDAYNSTRADAG